MDNFLDIALDMASKKGQNILRQNQARQAEIENEYLPEKYKTAIMLQQMQARKIPYDIQNMQSQGAYRSAMSRALLEEAARKRELFETQKKMYDMYLNQGVGGQLPGGAQGMKMPGIGVLSLNKGLPMQQVDPITGEMMTRITTPQSKTQQTLYYNPSDSKVYASLTTAMQNRLQKSAVALPQIIDVMKELAPAISPYLGAKGRARYILDKGRAFYANKDIPALSKYEAAMDDMKGSAEQLLSSNNLNITDQSTHMMMSVLMPRKNDNEYTYSRRILKHIEKELARQQTVSKIMGRGIPLGNYGQIGSQMAPQQFGMDDQSLDEALNSLE